MKVFFVLSLLLLYCLSCPVIAAVTVTSLSRGLNTGPAPRSHAHDNTPISPRDDYLTTRSAYSSS
ncbi:hypothetical protein L209DRAFT_755574 [Thermothelomyces heterothallicus CBS 203.75]